MTITVMTALRAQTIVEDVPETGISPQISPRSLMVIGHRGAPGYRPEHTEAAYRLAFELGVDAVEPDVVVTRDGVLVVRHENEISGTTDVASRREFASRRTTKVVDGVKHTGWFTEDFTWAELQTLRSRERLQKIRADNREFEGQEGILRFSDVLALIDEASAAYGRDFGIVIEIKHADYFLQLGWDLAQLVCDELRACGWIDRADGADGTDRSHRLTYECFELGVLDRLRDLNAPGKRVFLLEEAGGPADEIGQAAPRSFAWYRSDDGLDSLAGRVDGISLDKRTLLRTDLAGRAIGTTDVVDRAHTRGLTVFVWTLRPENYFLNTRYRSSRRGADWGDWLREFRMIARSGVDGIFVDHPDLGVQLREHLWGERS